MSVYLRCGALFGLCAVVGLAIACGGGGSGGGGGGSSTTVSLSGTVSFATASEKITTADTSASPTVIVRNLTSGVESSTTADDDGNFTITVYAGDCEVISRNADGTTVRKVLPGVSSANSSAGAVNVDSTAVAVMCYAVFVEGNDSVSSLAGVQDLDDTVSFLETQVANREGILQGSTAGDAETALMALSVYDLVQAAMLANTDLSETSGNNWIVLTEIQANLDDALTEILTESPGTSVTVGDRTYDDTSDVPSDLSSVASVDAVELGLESDQAQATYVPLAVVTTRTSDWAAGSVSTVTTTGSRSASNNLITADTSDQDIMSYGGYAYVLRKYAADNVIKVDGSNVSSGGVAYQYSTLQSSETSSGNPHCITFASATKAYVSRFEYNTILVVDPSATSESNFQTGTIDLADFADADGVAEITMSVIVGTKLFVALQRLERQDSYTWVPSNTSYVVVIDTATDTVIDTDSSTAGTQAISLSVRNPEAIQYSSETGLVYVMGVGRYPLTAAAEYTGGIESIDPDTYATTVVVDDDAGGTGTATYGGNICKMLIVSSTKGYLATYAGWGDNSVRPFNPTTGEVGDVITGLTGKNIAGLAVDDFGYLWVLEAGYTAPGIMIFDTTTNAQVGSVIELEGMAPTGITFVDVQQ